MWQILRALLGPEAAMLTMGDGRGDNSGNEMEALQKAYSEAHAKKMAAQSGGLTSPPVAAPPSPSAPAPNTDNWGVMGMPSAVPASQGFPNQPQPAPAQAQAPMQVPMPQARPMGAPQQASAQPDTSFFMRNALMQQDPNGGGYIDPQGAGSVRGPDLIAKMMSYLHNKDMA
jgi:hypothetical protein